MANATTSVDQLKSYKIKSKELSEQSVETFSTANVSPGTGRGSLHICGCSLTFLKASLVRENVLLDCGGRGRGFAFICSCGVTVECFSWPVELSKKSGFSVWEVSGIVFGVDLYSLC